MLRSVCGVEGAKGGVFKISWELGWDTDIADQSTKP